MKYTKSFAPPIFKDVQLNKSMYELRKELDKIFMVLNIPPIEWIAPTLLNSWENYGGGFNPAGYFKDSLGIVHIRGRVKDGVIGASIFTLPEGYRPAYTEVLVTISNHALGQIRILANGDVNAYAGSNAWFSLDGITFRAE